MEVHIKCVHNKIKDAFCDLCGKAFGTEKEMKVHKKSVHEGIKPIRTDKNVKCNFCGKVFSRGHHLKRHIASVHEGINYKCQVCGKSFNRPYLLQQHIKIAHDPQLPLLSNDPKDQKLFQNSPEFPKFI